MFYLYCMNSLVCRFAGKAFQCLETPGSLRSTWSGMRLKRSLLSLKKCKLHDVRQVVLIPVVVETAFGSNFSEYFCVSLPRNRPTVQKPRESTQDLAAASRTQRTSKATLDVDYPSVSVGGRVKSGPISAQNTLGMMGLLWQAASFAQRYYLHVILLTWSPTWQVCIGMTTCETWWRMKRWLFVAVL